MSDKISSAGDRDLTTAPREPWIDVLKALIENDLERTGHPVLDVEYMREPPHAQR